LRGAVVELSEKSLTLQTSAGPQVLDTSALQSVKSASAADIQPEETPAVWVDLADNSSLHGLAFTLVEGEANVQGMTHEKLSLPARVVRAVRFYMQQETVQKQWSAIASEARVGDVLVVRKVNPNGTGPGDVVLDQLPGVVREIRDNNVVFEFDNERLEVPRAKIEGILFRPLPATEMSEPKCRVKDRDGGIWQVKSLTLKQDRLVLETVAGASLQLVAQRLLEIDFSSANLLYLSDLEAESSDYKPYFNSASTPSSVRDWFKPRGAPLTLAGTTYEKGLMLHSRTVMSYRLPQNYRQFVATVGIDEKYRSTANLTLVISGDGRPLLTRTIKGEDEPFGVELNIDGVRRLRILVDFGEDLSDAGDLLFLCDARLVK